MIIDSWYRNPVLDAGKGYKCYIRSTPTFHGLVIKRPTSNPALPDGPLPSENYMGDGYYSPRRYSVIREYPNGHLELIIGSLYYMRDGFDSESIDAPLQKVLDGQFAVLYRIPTNRTIDIVNEPSDWHGSSQELELKFG